MKVFWNEKGSCRGCGFSHKGSFESEEIEKLLKIRDDEVFEEKSDEMLEDDIDLLMIISDIYHSKGLRRVYRKAVRDGRGYICLEESVVGFGKNANEAKLGILDAIEDGEWMI